MAERPEGVDPDATVSIPSLKAELDAGIDPDATVSMPIPLPPPLPVSPVPPVQPAPAVAQVAEPDPEATDPIARSPFYLPPDSDATVAMPQAAVTTVDFHLEADPDATIAIPTPGKRRNPFAPKPGRDAVRADLGALGGLNPLVEAANPILGAVPQLRQSLRHPDPGSLRDSLAEQLESFEAAAGVAGVSEDTVQVARHALCALLDESAARTPWGATWAGNGLVRILLDGDTSGAKFFDDLEQALQAPQPNADLLEFFHACLALGYEGKYRDAEGGAEALEAIRQRLHAQVVSRRPLPADGELSTRWRGMATRTREMPVALLMWGAASALALALVALYLYYGASLGSQSDPVARELAQIRPPAVAAVSAPVAGAAAVERVAPQLAEEIRLGLVAVTEDAQRSTIVVRGDRLFASGSARLDPAIEPVMARIAEALERVPGSILVTGHTDDVPIRSARFHSNWELSTARAQSVVKLMAAKISDPARLKAEGVADSQPLGANDSDAARARNRRVAIILRAAP